jgi:mannosyltransferase
LVFLAWGAFAYHLLDLTRQSLWPDEVYSLVVSGWTLEQTWHDLIGDHVPLYTIVLGGWRYATGSSELSLRYFSVICATLSVPLVVVLARRLLDPASGFVAGILLAISPFQLYYAQEVVTYAFFGTLVLLSSWVYLRRTADPSGKALLVAGLLYAALAYTHYAGLFLVATHVAIWCGSLVLRWIGRGMQSESLLSLPRFSRRWPVAWVLGGVLFAPWFLTHLSSVSGNFVGGTSKTLRQLIGSSFLDLTFGYAMGNHLDAANPIDMRVFNNLGWLSLLVPLGCALAVLPRRRVTGFAIHSGSILAVLHVVIPYGLLLALVQGTREFSSRYGFPATLWLPIAIAAGLWYVRPPFRWLGVIILTGFSLWGGLIYFEHPGFARLDLRSATSYIVNNLQPGDGVVVTAPYVASTFDYYSAAAGADVAGMPLPAAIPSDDSQTRTAIAAMGSSHSRLWWLRWQDDFADPHGIISKWLQANAIRDRQRDWGGGLVIELWLTRSPRLAELPASAIPAAGVLGDQARFVGYELASDWPGTLTITLYWSLSEPLPSDYTIFVHVLDHAGRTLANGDSEPYRGQFPTSRWPVGEIVRDVHEVRLDPCAASDRFSAETGFYVPKTMQRLGTPGKDSIGFSMERSPGIRQGPGLGAVLARLPAALRLDERLPADSRSLCASS